MTQLRCSVSPPTSLEHSYSWKNNSEHKINPRKIVFRRRKSRIFQVCSSNGLFDSYLKTTSQYISTRRYLPRTVLGSYVRGEKYYTKIARPQPNHLRPVYRGNVPTTTLPITGKILKQQVYVIDWIQPSTWSKCASCRNREKWFEDIENLSTAWWTSNVVSESMKVNYTLRLKNLTTH